MAARIACDEEHDTKTIYFTNIDENSTSEGDYANSNEKDCVGPIDLKYDGGEYDTSAIYFTNNNENLAYEGHYVYGNDDEYIDTNKLDDEGYHDESLGVYNSSEASGNYDSLEYTSATVNNDIELQTTPKNEIREKFHGSNGHTKKTNLLFLITATIFITLLISFGTVFVLWVNKALPLPPSNAPPNSTEMSQLNHSIEMRFLTPWSSWFSVGSCSENCGDGVQAFVREKDSYKEYKLDSCHLRNCTGYPTGDCPTKIIINSNGSFMHTSSSRLGIYKLIRYDSHGYAIYEHETTKDTYLYSYSNNIVSGFQWMVGDKTHGYSDILFHSKCPHYCPNDCDNKWKYGRGSISWGYDNTIRLETKVPACCNILNISSQGDTKHMYSNALGIYQYWTMSGKNRVYKHSSENNYLFKSGAGKWLVSSIIGSEQGLLSHPFCSGMKCPESCAEKVWERGIATNSSYLTDSFLDVSCS